MFRKTAIVVMAAVLSLMLGACGNKQEPVQNTVQPDNAESTQVVDNGGDKQTEVPHSMESNMDQLIAENENLQFERDAISDILWDDALRMQSEQRMAYITDAKMQGDALSVTLQTVNWLTGDQAVEAVMQDKGLSREQAALETEGGYYIQETDQTGTYMVREGAIFYMEEPFSRMQMEGAEFLLWWGDADEPWQNQLPYQALIYQDEVILLQSFYLP